MTLILANKFLIRDPKLKPNNTKYLSPKLDCYFLGLLLDSASEVGGYPKESCIKD